MARVPNSGARRSIVLTMVVASLASRSAAAQSFFPPVLVNETTLFRQTISTGGAVPILGLVLICEGEPGQKPFVPPGQPMPPFAWQVLCGNTLPNFGISDIVAFTPGPNGLTSGLVIQMASDADADAMPADVTPLPGVFINSNITAITEQIGPSGFIEYAPNVDQPGFFTNGSQFPLYYIQSDCQPTAEHLTTCGMPQLIAPQCGDPGGDCGVLTGQTFPAPEPEEWRLLLAGVGVLGLTRRVRRRTTSLTRSSA
jgi:hypothetical protein